MKKKIKDLTITDTIVVCNKQNTCYDCPLVNVCASIPVYLQEQHKEDLEKEIDL